MASQRYVQPLVYDIADGAQILNTTSETIVCPDYSFAANDPLLFPGARITGRLYGDISFVITTPGTLIWRIRWGGVAGTVLANSGAYAPDPTAALANRSYWLEFDITVRSIGAAGSMFCMAKWGINDVDDASATTLQGNLAMMTFSSGSGGNTPAVVSSLDTTTAKLLSVTAQFSVNTATTQLTNHLRYLDHI